MLNHILRIRFNLEDGHFVPVFNGERVDGAMGLWSMVNGGTKVG